MTSLKKWPNHLKNLNIFLIGRGWWPGHKEQDIAAVLSSDLAIGAWDGERLIGFARVISDHRLHAYIDDVMVHPNYQRHGVGRQLLTKLLTALQHIETITLFCQLELLEFYRQSGFRAFPSQVVMHQKGKDYHRSLKI